MPRIFHPGYAQLDPSPTKAAFPPVPPVWNRAVYDALASALGPDRISRIARQFLDDLATRFDQCEDSNTLRRDAHVIISSAGLLGFVGLSKAAKDLESACTDDHDIEAYFAAAISAKTAAMRTLTELLPPTK